MTPSAGLSAYRRTWTVNARTGRKWDTFKRSSVPSQPHSFFFSPPPPPPPLSLNSLIPAVAPLRRFSLSPASVRPRRWFIRGAWWCHNERRWSSVGDKKGKKKKSSDHCMLCAHARAVPNQQAAVESAAESVSDHVDRTEASARLFTRKKKKKSVIRWLNRGNFLSVWFITKSNGSGEGSGCEAVMWPFPSVQSHACWVNWLLWITGGCERGCDCFFSQPRTVDRQTDR